MTGCLENRAERRERQRRERREKRRGRYFVPIERSDAFGLRIDLCPRCGVRLRHGDSVGERGRSEPGHKPVWHWRCLLAENIERESGRSVSPPDLPEFPDLPEGFREVDRDGG